MPGKIIIPILWVAGVAAMAYGMLMHNNFVLKIPAVPPPLGGIYAGGAQVRNVPIHPP